MAKFSFCYQRIIFQINIFLNLFLENNCKIYAEKNFKSKGKTFLQRKKCYLSVGQFLKMCYSTSPHFFVKICVIHSRTPWSEEINEEDFRRFSNVMEGNGMK